MKAKNDDPSYVKKLAAARKVYFASGASRRVASSIGKVTGPANFAKYNEERRRNHKVVSVRNGPVIDVYDLTVDETQNFALACGIFVHNSKDVADAMAAVCYHVFDSVVGSV